MSLDKLCSISIYKQQTCEVDWEMIQLFWKNLENYIRQEAERRVKQSKINCVDFLQLQTAFVCSGYIESAGTKSFSTLPACCLVLSAHHFTLLCLEPNSTTLTVGLSLSGFTFIYVSLMKLTSSMQKEENYRTGYVCIIPSLALMLPATECLHSG